MAEGEARTGSDGPNFPTFRFEVPPISSNGHAKRRTPSRLRGALRGAPAGLLVTGLLGTSVVPRLHLLNLAFYNPWPRPVIASGLGGVAAGASRRGTPAAAAAVGAACAVAGLWIVYAMTRLQNPVLFVERSALHVALADLARLAAYTIPAGALGALAGRLLRKTVEVLQARRARPLTKI